MNGKDRPMMRSFSLRTTGLSRAVVARPAHFHWLSDPSVYLLMEAENGTPNTERPTSNTELTARAAGSHHEGREEREERQWTVLKTARTKWNWQPNNATTQQLPPLAGMRLLGRLLGGCLDIAKQPNDKSVGSRSTVMGCDAKSRRGTLLSSVFFFRRCFGSGKRRKVLTTKVTKNTKNGAAL